MSTQDEAPCGGLWVYTRGQFHHKLVEGCDHKTNHVEWFRSLGLPDYGPEYDKMLRGRLTWERHFEHYVLSWYGDRDLPNQVYDLVAQHFNAGDHTIVEKPIGSVWM